MSKEPESKVQNPFILDAQAVSRLAEIPTQLCSVMIETTQKSQEASVAYFRQLEQIQRDYFKAVTGLWSQVLPGESKLWEAQIKAVENGFEILNKMTGAGKKAA